MAESKEKCKNCRWWLLSTQAPSDSPGMETGECRRQPPIAIALPSAKTGKWGIRTVWPATRAQHWCAEHSEYGQQAQAVIHNNATQQDSASANSSLEVPAGQGPVSSPSPLHDSQAMVQTAIDKKYQGKTLPKASSDAKKKPTTQNEAHTKKPVIAPKTAKIEKKAAVKTESPSEDVSQKSAKTPAAKQAHAPRTEQAKAPTPKIQPKKQPSSAQPKSQAQKDSTGNKTATTTADIRQSPSEKTVPNTEEEGLSKADQLALTGGVQLKKDLDSHIPTFEESEAYKVIQKFQRPKEDEDVEEKKGDEEAPEKLEMYKKVQAARNDSEFMSLRQKYPSASQKDYAGQEGWRMTRKAFFAQAPQPITKQMLKAEGKRPITFFLYGRRAEPVLILPTVVVGDDIEKAKAWFHAELLQIALDEMREIPAAVREEYGV